MAALVARGSGEQERDSRQFQVHATIRSRTATLLPGQTLAANRRPLYVKEIYAKQDCFLRRLHPAHGRGRPSRCDDGLLRLGLQREHPLLQLQRRLLQLDGQPLWHQLGLRRRVNRHWRLHQPLLSSPRNLYGNPDCNKCERSDSYGLENDHCQPSTARPLAERILTQISAGARRLDPNIVFEPIRPRETS